MPNFSALLDEMTKLNERQKRKQKELSKIERELKAVWVELCEIFTPVINKALKKYNSSPVFGMTLEVDGYYINETYDGLVVRGILEVNGLEPDEEFSSDEANRIFSTFAPTANQELKDAGLPLTLMTLRFPPCYYSK